MKRYQFGFCEWYLPFSGPSVLSFCADMGYDGIQIGDLGGSAQNFPLTNPRLAQAYVDASKKTGVELQCLNMISVIYNGCLKGTPNSEQGKLAELTMRKAFDACRMMGIQNAFIPSVLSSRIENQFDLENTIQNLSFGKKMADEMGITFLYESFSPIEETEEICSRTGMQLMYDTMNPIKFGFGKDGPTEIKTYGTRLIHTIHFKDWTPSIPGDVPMGEGVGMVSECVKAIKAIGYQGWIINEGTYFKSRLAAQGADPWEIASRDLKTLRTLFEEE